MKLATVDHVWFWVRNMDRAVAFYRDALGLPARMRHGDDWAEFDGGGIRIGLHGAGSAGAIPHGGTAVFVVEDLDIAKASLQERGVVFDDHLGEVPGSARYASFADPDGNSMQIIEYRDPAANRQEGSSSEAVAHRQEGSSSEAVAHRQEGSSSEAVAHGHEGSTTEAGAVRQEASG